MPITLAANASQFWQLSSPQSQPLALPPTASSLSTLTIPAFTSSAKAFLRLAALLPFLTLPVTAVLSLDPGLARRYAATPWRSYQLRL